MSLRDYLFYEEPGITLYCGDCREVLPLLDEPDALLIADPPYGVNVQRGDGRASERVIRGDHIPFRHFDLWPYRVDRDPMVLFGANAYADSLPASTGWIIWDKTFPDCAEQSQAELAWTNFVRGIRIHREAYHGFMRKPDGWHHPAQKPVRLFTWILGLRWTPQGGPVLDPYSGSGTILIAAKDLGRQAIGIEIEPKYCEIAVKRLRQEVLDFA